MCRPEAFIVWSNWDSKPPERVFWLGHFRSLCMPNMSWKPRLMYLTFAKHGRRFWHLGQRVPLQFGQSRCYINHLLWICLTRFRFLRCGTLRFGQSALGFELFCFLQPQSLVSGYFLSARCTCWCIILLYLHPPQAQSARFFTKFHSVGVDIDKRTSLAALALSLLGTLLTL